MEPTLKAFVSKTIDFHRSDLQQLSQELWKNPETKFQEVYAHSYLADYLEKNGFSVRKRYCLPTAFRAEFTRHIADDSNEMPTVAILCEYDALPALGHACGHNLIAEAAVGAAIGIKAAMQSQYRIPGKVIVLGCPAEEMNGGGKIELLQNGAFSEIQFAVMVHPAPVDILESSPVSSQMIWVNFKGRPVHSATWPWEGRNALDAAVICYNALSVMRQQMKPSWRLHCIVSKGGDTPNIIPGSSELTCMVRTPSYRERMDLNAALKNCCEAAAKASGSSLSLEFSNKPYEAIHSNKLMLDRYRQHAESLGVNFNKVTGNFPFEKYLASESMGNVSQAVPSIFVNFRIPHPAASADALAKGSRGGQEGNSLHSGTTEFLLNHTHDFAKAAGSPSAQNATIVAAKSLALTVLDVLLFKELRDAVKQEFAAQDYFVKPEVIAPVVYANLPNTEPNMI